MAAPVLPPRLRDGDRLTRDEFLRRWEQMPELKRAELIDGIVSMPSPVSRIHGNFHFRLSYWLGSYVSATPGCEGGLAGTWLMSPDSAPQPDLAIKIDPAYGGQSRVEGEYPAGAPELIVEISHTTSARDRGAKLRLYERSGVREYVTVRPEQQQIVWRELADGRYREIAAEEEGVFRSRVFPGLWLDPAPLSAGDLQSLAATVQRGIATPEHTEFVDRLASSKLRD
jgi:Uma2 family endonuclease